MQVKVLIADDMKNFLDLETSFLSRTDCNILKAVNGLDALRIAKAEKPDIIFLDLEMPVMDGIECCRFIKSDIDIKDIPVVIVTASSKEEECSRAGCSSYLRKPVDEDIFIREIKKFVKIKERSDPRFDVSMDATVQYKGTKISGVIENISASGVLLRTEEPLGIGSVIALDFILPNKKDKIKTKAIIVRTSAVKISKDTGIGLRFFEIDEKHQMLINSFIDEHSKTI